MKFPFYIAWRYLFSKKKHNVINIISAVSMLGVGIGAMALIVIMSAFNGLENLVAGLYSSFDPDIKITVKEGKVFNAGAISKEEILKIKGVKYYCEALEETVYIRYKDHEVIATIKGVEEAFDEMSGIDSMITEGEFILKTNGNNFAVAGYGIAYKLGLNIENVLEPLRIYTARREEISTLQPEQAFKLGNIMPSGIFMINQDFDFKYLLVPIDFARELLERGPEISSVEIGLTDDADKQYVKKEISRLAGDKFEVKTRYELNELIFKTNKTEKWITYLILTFILVIATFNVIGSLTMLILEKKEDMHILRSLGAEKKAIQKIFLFEGLMITFLGGISGLILGALLCAGQQLFGFVRLQGTIVEYYPVKLLPFDFITVILTVLLIGFFASWLPVKYVTAKYLR